MRRPSRRSVRYVLIAAMALAIFGLGGVFKEVIVGTSVVALLALALSTVRSPHVRVDAFGWLLIGITALTALQAVPLPFSLISWLAPNTAETLRAGAAARGLAAPESACISLDPESTRLAIIWWLAVTATYLTGQRLQRHRSEQAPILVMIPVLGLLVLAVGLIHAVLGWTTVYGIYEPVYQESTETSGALFRSVFLNPNHLAAFLNCGVAISLAWAGTTYVSGRARILWMACFLVLSVGVVLTGSRAGILCGALAVGVILLAQRSKFSLATAGAIAAGLLMLIVIFPAGEQLATLAGLPEWSETTHHETHMLGLDVAKRWAWSGAGRGAFGVAHTQLGPDRHYYITHAHNTPLQLFADYGFLFGGLILLAGIGLMIRPLLKAVRAPLGVGAAAALLALVTHNLVDFSLDILGVALPGVLLVAALRVHESGTKMSWGTLTGGALGSMAIVLALAQAIGPEAGPRRETLILARPDIAIERYPADAYAYLGAGLQARDPALVRHAAVLHPLEPRIHLAAAALGTAEERPAAIQSALSTVRSYRFISRCFEFIRRTARHARDVLDSLPGGAMTARYIQWQKTPDGPLMTAALARYPESAPLLRAVGRIYLSTQRLQDADDIATRLVLLEDPEGYRLMGDVFLAENKPLRAHHMFIAAGDPESLIRAARIAIDAGLPRRAIVALDNAKTEPKYLKVMRTLRSEAVSLLKISTDEPQTALEVFESDRTP